MTNAINKQTLSEQIYLILREDILTQEIKCGQRLTLKSLKERFNVSHTPIREALTRLLEDDLVKYYSNVGVTVIELTTNDVREIFQLSGDLDCLALKYSINGEQVEALKTELTEIISRSKDCINEQDFQAWKEHSDRFHLVFYDYANNSRLQNAAHKLRAQLTLLSNLYQLETENCLNIQYDHERVFDALMGNDFENARELLRQHLNNDMVYALNVVKQV